MISPMRRAVVIGCILLISGCASPLQKLRELNPSADDFASSLASEYLAYADSESEQGRKLVAEHYADKGLKALQGKNVEPEPIDISLPQQDQGELTVARAQLMALLTDDMKRASPQQLARAQLLFDCWQHELKKRINQELAPCADEFKATLAELQQLADDFLYNDETEHRLTFKKNSASLTSEDLALVKIIAVQTARRSHYAIEITALDAMGDRQRKLTAARLSAVHKALAKAGIAEKHIRLKKEAGDKKVHLSCDVSPENPDTVTVTVKTLKTKSGD